MKIRCIIVFFILTMFVSNEGLAANEIQIENNALELLRHHFAFVFETQTIDLDNQKPQEENVGIRLVNVDEMNEVTISFKGGILKAKEECVFPSLIKNGFLVVSYAGKKRGGYYASLELYIPKKNTQHRYHMQQLLSILLGDSPPKKKIVNSDSNQDDLGASLFKSLTSFQKLKTNLEFPKHLIGKDGGKQGDEFDVEKYFSVLKHISMEEGYRLDYVYQLGGISGSPILYSRKKDTPPYTKYEEYVEAIREEAHLDEVELINKEYHKKIETVGIVSANEWREKQLEKFPNYKHWQWYLNDVCVDGTPESWLELVVLYLLGDQFYLFWHSGYNDTMIISDYSSLPAVSDQYVSPERKVSPIMSLLGSALDIRPLVEVKDETVFVSIVSFSKWGGFNEQVFSINKERPHKITQISDNTLILYHCGVVF